MSNEQRSYNLTFFPQAYNTNYTASYKYLTTNQCRQQLQSSNASPLNMYHSHSIQKDSDKKQSILKSSNKKQAQSRSGSVLGKTNPDVIPPIRSLNREDRDKLIASLLEQLKQQKLVIQHFEQKDQQHLHTALQLQQNVDCLIEKEQVYDNQNATIQTLNKKILQLSQLFQDQYQNQTLGPDDAIKILTTIYNQQCDTELASNWRNTRLQFTYFDKLKIAAKKEKIVRNSRRKLQSRLLQQIILQWRATTITRQLIQHQSMENQYKRYIKCWHNWKLYTQYKLVRKSQHLRAQNHYNRHQKTKAIRAIQGEYYSLNYSQVASNQIQKTITMKLIKLCKMRVFLSFRQVTRNQIINRVDLQEKVECLQKTLKHRLLQNWNNVVRSKKNLLQQFIEAKGKKQLEKNFYKWRALHNQYSVSFRQIQRNKPYRNKQTCLKQWQQKLKFRQQRRIREHQLITIIQGLKDKQGKLRVFLRWQQMLITSYNKNQQYHADQANYLEKQTQKYLFASEEGELKYQEALNQLHLQDEEIRNFRIVCDQNCELVEQLKSNEEFQWMQINSYKQEIEQLRVQNDELIILKEQLQSQLKTYSQSIHKRSFSQINTDLKQNQFEDINNQLFQEKQKTIQLEQDMRHMISRYELKIQEVEQHYKDLCETQKKQLDRLSREYKKLTQYNNLTEGSRSKLLGELQQLQSEYNVREGYPSQNKLSSAQNQTQDIQYKSTYKQSERKYSPPCRENHYERHHHKDEAIMLRENIKLRLATLQQQLDTNNL